MFVIYRLKPFINAVAKSCAILSCPADVIFIGLLLVAVIIHSFLINASICFPNAMAPALRFAPMVSRWQMSQGLKIIFPLLRTSTEEVCSGTGWLTVIPSLLLSLWRLNELVFKKKKKEKSKSGLI